MGLWQLVMSSQGGRSIPYVTLGVMKVSSFKRASSVKRRSTTNHVVQREKSKEALAEGRISISITAEAKGQ